MLLHTLLAQLAVGGMHSTAELARRLGVTEGLVAAMADDLARRGYLASVAADCATACEGCSLAARCAPSGPDMRRPTLLALTAKGQQAVGSGI